MLKVIVQKMSAEDATLADELFELSFIGLFIMIASCPATTLPLKALTKQDTPFLLGNHPAFQGT